MVVRQHGESGAKLSFGALGPSLPKVEVARPQVKPGALLARKEWHIRYRSAKLGYAWAVLQPLLLMGVLLTVFGYVVPVLSPWLSTQAVRRFRLS